MAVQVRPLRQITGEAEFNELFIEDARIPDANIIGGVGNGWKVAITTLMNERAGARLRAADPPAPAARRPDRAPPGRGCCDDPLHRRRVSPELHSPLIESDAPAQAWKGLTDA